MHQFDITEHFLTRNLIPMSTVSIRIVKKRTLKRLFKKLRKRRKKLLKLMFGKQKRSFGLAPAM